MSKSDFPAWYYGPDGAAKVFNTAGDIPEGWKDHPSKVISPASTGNKPLAAVVDEIPPGQLGVEPVHVGEQTKNNSPVPHDVSNDLDKAGWAWDAEIHTADQTKTNFGLWKLKPGKVRPDPKPGFDRVEFDL